MSFTDRQEAGRKLAEQLIRYKDERPVVLGLPRGGVPVAAEIASALSAPLDLILVRKIGVPWQPELAMGAAVDGEAPLIVRNDDVIRLAGISEAEFNAVCEKELAEIERRRKAYLGNRLRVNVEGRIAIVVDDGIATGATVRAGLHAMRTRRPQKLVLAVPVGPSETIENMKAEADEVICLESHEFFHAISIYYGDFKQVTDQEVMELLAQFPERE